MSHRADWDRAYREKDHSDLSWHEPVPELSLSLIQQAGIGPHDAVVDIGAGSSPLLRALAAAGFDDLTALDLSEAALAGLRNDLPDGALTETLIADVCHWQPQRRYALWHDRAALHFLTTPQDQADYAATLTRALAPNGHAIIATFAPDGPEKCFGQPVQRHDGTSLHRLLGPAFRLINEQRHVHTTPSGVEQRYCYTLFQRVG